MKANSFSSRDKAENLGHTQVETEAEIRRRAYALYEKGGKADGHALEDWLKAEAEVLQPRHRLAA